MFRFTKRPALHLFICLTTFVWLSGCNTARYFATPDYFTKQPGILVLKNGENIPGKISVNNLIGNTVTIWPYSNGGKQVYTVKEVTSCKLDIVVFEPMSVVRELPELSTRLIFMEKLTPDSFSISLYEAYERQTDPNLMGDVTLQGGVEYDLMYYVHLPGDERIIVRQISTPVLTTKLSNGLDSLFHTCPVLYNKIHSGDPAYNYSFSPQVPITNKIMVGRLSTKAKEEKVNIMIKVFTEYEQCKRQQR
jgi:hypothetical protein